MGRIIAFFHPSIDRRCRHLSLGLIGIQDFQTPGDLLGRPILRKATADDFVKFFVFQFSLQRPLAPAALGQVPGRTSMVAVVMAVATQFS